MEYDYEIIHRKGALHYAPDALSRMFEDDTEVSLMAVEKEIFDDAEDPWYHRCFRKIESVHD